MSPTKTRGISLAHAHKKGFYYTWYTVSAYLRISLLHVLHVVSTGGWLLFTTLLGTALPTLLRRVKHSWYSILHLLLSTHYSVSLLIQPTCIGKSIRNVQGHWSNSATRLCFYSYLVDRFRPSYHLFLL